MLKKIVLIFSSIFGSRRVLAPFGLQIWKWNQDDNYFLSTNAENFSYLSLIISEKKSGQQHPLKQENKRLLQTGSDVIKTKKSISNFYDLLP